ncbi:NAD(P)/FAD-dependent oxidoreductase [Pedobacter caeni]|uniref:Predicted NAD/FAD-binding protein n=1 Tax=Pedobacter caeni TaxID=288992 RepID=A0A1M4YXD0_9SPHI|nr:FAD-dependent oxidoreductase [Pedobacter caeni]SHF10368.1 Predicted NAD/FAD-binding protein [Pedobacter caeni]
MEKVAIIGAGIAGMSCGHFLHEKYDLTLYEEQDHIGGCTPLVTLKDAENPVSITAGSLVIHPQTDPQLYALFEAIKVPLKKTDLSFSVQYLPEQLEYRGPGLNHLFAQRSNLFKPSFLKLLKEVGRFNKSSTEVLNQPEFQNCSIASYLKEFGYTGDFILKYLIPLSSGLWTAPKAQILDFPIVTLLRHFNSYGFAGQASGYQGFTPDDKNQPWQEVLTRPFKDKILLNKKVGKVERLEDGKVKVLATDGTKGLFDRVIMACPADEAYKIVKHKTKDEERLLSVFRYESGKNVIHTDAAIMPKTKLAWASWNYRMEQKGEDARAAATYWINNIPGLPETSLKQDYFVSNAAAAIDEKKMIREIENRQPVFDLMAMQAQTELHLLNQTGPVYYCGGYFNNEKEKTASLFGG